MSKHVHGGTKEWGVTKFPSFEGEKVYVLPGAFYSSVVSMMAAAGFAKASGLDDADLVVFTGGSDIDPVLYGEENIYCYGIDSNRDELEKRVYELSKDKVKFGICRGAQFLAAMNGAKLWQDVNNHSKDHYIIDLDLDVRVKATSIHRQMIQDHDALEVVAVCENPVATLLRDSTGTYDYRGKSVEYPEAEIEAGAYPESKCFFVQGHPEIGTVEYKSWVLTRLQDYMNDWTGKITSIETVLERLK